MIPFSVEDYKSSKLTVFALIILLSLFTCFCHLPFAAPQKPPTSESDETAEEILLDYDSLAELGTSIAIPEFDINRIEYELDANGSLVWMEYPLEEDVLFDQVPADISLVYTAGDQKVNEALVYTFRDVGEIDSLWLALPKSLVESVGSVADFSAISELSGLKITDIVIHDVDPLIELINAKIEETDAAIAITGRILDIDLESPNGIDELTASVKVHAQTLGRIRGLRQQLNSALKVASTKGKESEASEQIQALLILYPDSFFRSDCDQLESRSTLYAYYLCKAITHQSGQWCNKVTESDGCKSLTYNALTRRHPACGSLPSREEIEQCLMLAAVKADYEKGCKSRDSAFGHRIENQDIQKACIAGVKQDPVQCNSITDEAAREQCCNLMQVTSLRQQCMGSFEEYDYENWFTNENAGGYCIDLQPGSTKQRFAEAINTSLQCLYTLDTGGELDVEILPLPSDASADRNWESSVEWFYDEQAGGTFSDFVEASIIPVPPYEIYLVQQNTGGWPDFAEGFLVEVISMHGNCLISATENEVPGTGGVVAREAINKARHLVDQLRGK